MPFHIYTFYVILLEISGLPGEPKPQTSQKKPGDNSFSGEKGMYTDHDFWKEQVDAMVCAINILLKT